MGVYLLLPCAFSYFPVSYNKHVNKRIFREKWRSKELEKSNTDNAKKPTQLLPLKSKCLFCLRQSLCSFLFLQGQQSFVKHILNVHQTPEPGWRNERWGWWPWSTCSQERIRRNKTPRALSTAKTCSVSVFVFKVAIIRACGEQRSECHDLTEPEKELTPKGDGGWMSSHGASQKDHSWVELSQ